MSPGGEQGIAEPTHLVEQTFEETLAANQGFVMVDFSAAWCGRCQAIAPVLEELVEASEGRVVLIKVNVDESPSPSSREPGREVAFIARGAHLEAIQRRGVTVRTPKASSRSPSRQAPTPPGWSCRSRPRLSEVVRH